MCAAALRIEENLFSCATVDQPVWQKCHIKNFSAVDGKKAK